MSAVVSFDLTCGVSIELCRIDFVLSLQAKSIIDDMTMRGLNLWQLTLEHLRWNGNSELSARNKCLIESLILRIRTNAQ